MLTFDGIRNNSFFWRCFLETKRFKYRNFDKDQIFSYLNTNTTRRNFRKKNSFGEYWIVGSRKSVNDI